MIGPRLVLLLGLQKLVQLSFSVLPLLLQFFLLVLVGLLGREKGLSLLLG